MFKVLDEVKYIIDDFKYRHFDKEERCGDCPVANHYRTSYEYDEWDYDCMLGKDVFDGEPCYIPMFILRIAKNRIEKRHMERHEIECNNFVAWLEEQEERKSDV